VHTPEELDNLLNDKEFNVADRLRLIEVYMPRLVEGTGAAPVPSKSKLNVPRGAQG